MGEPVFTSTLLGVDSSTDACSVALRTPSGSFSRFEVVPQGHARRLPGMVQEVMSEAGMSLSSVQGLVASAGPGSFTGIRIAVGLVQGLAFGLNRPVLGVSTLEVLAEGMLHTAEACRGLSEQGAIWLLPLLDARMGEWYAAAWLARLDSAGRVTLVQAGEDRLLQAEAWLAWVCEIREAADAAGSVGEAPPAREQIPALLAGDVPRFLKSSALALPDWMQRRSSIFYPSSKHLLARATSRISDAEPFAGFGQPETLLPVYLREQVAWKKTEPSLFLSGNDK